MTFERDDLGALLKRLRDLGKGGKRQTERWIEIKVACQLKLEVKYLRAHTERESDTHTHNAYTVAIRQSSVEYGGEASFIQQCPVTYQSYLPPAALLLSKTVSLFSPHTSLPGNPIAFS